MPHPENDFGNLTEQLLSVGRRKATGTLRVSGAGGCQKQFFFNQGCLADLDTGREDTALEAALTATGAYSEKDLKRARKAASRSGQTMGTTLLELGTLPEAEVAETIRRRLAEELCEVFAWGIEQVELVEHKPDERLEEFQSELSDLYEVLLDPEEVLIEVALRLGRWDLVVKSCSLLCDVVYATPGSFRYFHEQDQFPREHAILSRVDGTKDVEEVIAESGLDPFEAILIVRTLQTQGDLELINPVQMYQLGVECQSADKFEKAVRLFRRAHERGLDDFDLQLKLAQSLDSLGKHDEAIRRYTEFSDKCVQQLRAEDAIRCLRRVIKLDPGRLEAQEKLLEILLHQNRPQEAIEQAVVIAAKKADQGNPRDGLDLLIRVRSLNPRDIKLQQKIIDLAEACGDHPTARAEREVLAKNCDERKDVEMALETYQKMFCDGDDSLEVRLKLIQLHRARGNRQKALDHVNAILNLPDKRRVKDDDLLILLHETVRELKPSDLRSNRWLADHYAKKGDKTSATAVLKGWIGHLEVEGDLAEIVHAYEQLVALGDDPDHRWGLARALEKQGRLNECRRELRSLANLSLRRKELEQAAKALDYILRTTPLDIETRKLQADLCEAREDRGLAAKKHEEIAVLSILSGNVQDAESHCRRLSDAMPELAETVRKLGKLCQDQGDRQKAVEQTIKAAKIHLAQRNFGLCQAAVDQLFAIEPGHPEGKAIIVEMKSREAPPQLAPAPPGTAASAAFVTPTAFVSPVTPAVQGGLAAPAPYPAAAPAPPQAAGAASQLAAQPQLQPVAPARPAAPISPALADPLEREPFQAPKPVKTKVTGIMERLKRLKAGGSSPALVSPAVLQPPALASAGRAPSSEAISQSTAPAASTATTPTASNAALKSAASRLKALAGKKAQEAFGPGGPPPAASASPPPTPEACADSPAGSPAPAPAPAPAPGPAPHDAPTAMAAMNEINEKLAAAQPSDVASSQAVKPLRLQKSASRLAALRSQGA